MPTVESLPSFSPVSPVFKPVQTEGRTHEQRTVFPENVRVLIPYSNDFARYNAGVIALGGSDLLILVREVPIADVHAGTPDTGNLLIYRSTPERVERVAQLDVSDPGISNWEDPRAFVENGTDAESKNVLIGMTAIRAVDNKPVAATVRGNVTQGNFSLEEGSLQVYPRDEGKNVTPISLTHSLFRREGNRHSLEIVEHDTENGQNKLRVGSTIQFPKKPWCEWQIGTQAQFLPGGILPIHGVNRFSLGMDPHTGDEVFGYTYSLGLAQLDKDLKVTKVTDAPLFTRLSFENVLPMGRELDPNKDVIYCCGYSMEGNTVKFIINIGDLMTVEVPKNMSELQQALDESIPVAYNGMPTAAAA